MLSQHNIQYSLDCSINYIVFHIFIVKFVYIYNQYLTRFLQWKNQELLNFDILLLMANKIITFQAEFFSYEIPIPEVSVYTQSFVRSNDLRLLLEIATHSFLRMFTDSKTNCLHFICKQRGSPCFDVEAYPDESHPGNYYFPFDFRQLKHRGSCQQRNEAFRYLQIYNLMKLKKGEIQSFMRSSNLMKESPSTILSQLSNGTEEYFFQKYIRGQLELKRKLRKRFDNIVNIDIKKIGKNDERHELEGSPKKKIQKLVPYKISSRQKENFQTILPIVSPIGNKKRKIIKKEGRNIKRHQKTNQQESIQIQFPSSEYNERPPQNIESILLLNDDNTAQKEEIYFQSRSSRDLPELKVLSQQMDLFWSSSSEEDPSNKIEPPLEQIFSNKEDYFQSLRNSTLKKSLEKESLTLFTLDGEFNKENFA